MPKDAKRKRITPLIPNARFWAFVNRGWIKITLKSGQTLNHWQQQDTDEGWTGEGHAWEHCGSFVRREFIEDGRDCDGRLTHHTNDHCLIKDLKAVAMRKQHRALRYNHQDGYFYYETIYITDFERRMPDWQEPIRSQCDEYAEAAGY